MREKVTLEKIQNEIELLTVQEQLKLIENLIDKLLVHPVRIISFKVVRTNSSHARMKSEDGMLFL